MTISCNIKMLCLELNWFCYDLSRMLQLSEFVRNLRSSVWDVFNNLLIIDATYIRKISSDQKRLFIAVSLYPLSFFTNTPFNLLRASFIISGVIFAKTKFLSVFLLRDNQKLFLVEFGIFFASLGPILEKNVLKP